MVLAENDLFSYCLFFYLDFFFNFRQSAKMSGGASILSPEKRIEVNPFDVDAWNLLLRESQVFLKFCFIFYLNLVIFTLKFSSLKQLQNDTRFMWERIEKISNYRFSSNLFLFSKFRPDPSIKPARSTKVWWPSSRAQEDTGRPISITRLVLSKCFR